MVMELSSSDINYYRVTDDVVVDSSGNLLAVLSRSRDTDPHLVTIPEASVDVRQRAHRRGSRTSGALTQFNKMFPIARGLGASKKWEARCVIPWSRVFGDTQQTGAIMTAYLQRDRLVVMAVVGRLDHYSGESTLQTRLQVWRGADDLVLDISTAPQRYVNRTVAASVQEMYDSFQQAGLRTIYQDVMYAALLSAPDSWGDAMQLHQPTLTDKMLDVAATKKQFHRCLLTVIPRIQSIIAPR